MINPSTTTAPVDLDAPTPSGSRCNPSLTRDQENTIMTQKKSAAPSTELVDLDPVELDPRAPELVRWEALANRSVIVEHNGDAEKVMPFPRPEWADEDQDEVGNCLLHTYYNSRAAQVTVARELGHSDDDSWDPARVYVSGTIKGNGVSGVHITLSRTINKKWANSGITVSPSEALELADVLIAAVDMLGGTQ